MKGSDHPGSLVSSDAFKQSLDCTNNLIRALNGFSKPDTSLAAEIVNYLKFANNNRQKIDIFSFFEAIQAHSKQNVSIAEVPSIEKAILLHIEKYIRVNEQLYAFITSQKEKLEAETKSKEIDLKIPLKRSANQGILKIKRIAYGVSGLKVYFSRSGLDTIKSSRKFNSFLQIVNSSAELEEKSLKDIELICLKFVTDTTNRSCFLNKISKVLSDSQAEWMLQFRLDSEKDTLAHRVANVFCGKLRTEIAKHCNEYVSFEYLSERVAYDLIRDFMNSDFFKGILDISTCFKKLCSPDETAGRRYLSKDLIENTTDSFSLGKIFNELNNFFNVFALTKPYDFFEENKELTAVYNAAKNNLVKSLGCNEQLLNTLFLQAIPCENSPLSVIGIGDSYAIIDSAKYDFLTETQNWVSKWLQQAINTLWLYYGENLPDIELVRQFGYTIIQEFVFDSRQLNPLATYNLVKKANELAMRDNDVFLYTDASVKGNSYSISLVEQFSFKEPTPVKALCNSTDTEEISCDNAEISAVLLAISHAKSLLEKNSDLCIKILTDSQRALFRITRGISAVIDDYSNSSSDYSKTSIDLVDIPTMPGCVNEHVQRFLKKFDKDLLQNLKFFWIKGHSGILGNDMADMEAVSLRRSLASNQLG